MPEPHRGLVFGNVSRGTWVGAAWPDRFLAIAARQRLHFTGGLTSSQRQRASLRWQQQRHKSGQQQRYGRFVAARTMSSGCCQRGLKLYQLRAAWLRYWAAQWHLARAVDRRYRGCRAKRLYLHSSLVSHEGSPPWIVMWMITWMAMVSSQDRPREGARSAQRRVTRDVPHIQKRSKWAV